MFYRITWLLLCISLAYAEIPSYIKTCEAGNKECLLKNINAVFVHGLAGDDKFGLRKLNPIDVDTIAIRENPTSPVNINITLFNPKIYGAENVKAVNVKGFGKNPQGHHVVLLKASQITILSPYSVSGRVLILPVVGNGKSNLTFVKPQIKIDVEANSKVIDGQLFMDVKTVAMDVICERVHMYFGNLFNGDKLLGDNVNTFINENWEEIFNEMKRPILNGLAKPLLDTMTKIFTINPYTSMFA